MGPGLVNRNYVASREMKPSQIENALLSELFVKNNGGVPEISSETCDGQLQGDSAIPTAVTRYHKGIFPRVARVTITEYQFGPAHHNFGLVVKVTTNLPLEEAKRIIPEEKGNIPEVYLGIMSIGDPSS
jgi:hypothetical protein